MFGDGAVAKPIAMNRIVHEYSIPHRLGHADLPLPSCRGGFSKTERCPLPCRIAIILGVRTRSTVPGLCRVVRLEAGRKTATLV